MMVFDDSKPLSRKREDTDDLIGVAEIPMRELTVGDHKIRQHNYSVLLKGEMRGGLVVTIELMDPRGADAAKYYEGMRTTYSEEWRRRFLERVA